MKISFESAVKFWSHSYRKDMGVLKTFQWCPSKMTPSLRSQAYEKRLMMVGHPLLEYSCGGIAGKDDHLLLLHGLLLLCDGVQLNVLVSRLQLVCSSLLFVFLVSQEHHQYQHNELTATKLNFPLFIVCVSATGVHSDSDSSTNARR